MSSTFGLFLEARVRAELRALGLRAAALVLASSSPMVLLLLLRLDVAELPLSCGSVAGVLIGTPFFFRNENVVAWLVLAPVLLRVVAVVLVTLAGWFGGCSETTLGGTNDCPGKIEVLFFLVAAARLGLGCRTVL